MIILSFITCSVHWISSFESIPVKPLRILAKQPFVLIWKGLYRYHHFLPWITIISCAIRSIWPRIENDRTCFYNHWISVSSVGKVLATMDEVSLVIQIGLYMIQSTGKTKTATLLCAMNGFSQCCTWYAVLTTNQIGYIFEEIIWMLSLSLMVLELLDANLFLYSMYGICSILGRLFIMIPIYMYRYKKDGYNKKQYVTIVDGWMDLQFCHTSTQLDSYWLPHILWITISYSCMVCMSLGIHRSFVQMNLKDLV